MAVITKSIIIIIPVQQYLCMKPQESHCYTTGSHAKLWAKEQAGGA